VRLVWLLWLMACQWLVLLVWLLACLVYQLVWLMVWLVRLAWLVWLLAWLGQPNDGSECGAVTVSTLLCLELSEVAVLELSCSLNSSDCCATAFSGDLVTLHGEAALGPAGVFVEVCLLVARSAALAHCDVPPATLRGPA